jgi:hypothetical protein
MWINQRLRDNQLYIDPAEEGCFLRKNFSASITI